MVITEFIRQKFKTKEKYQKKNPDSHITTNAVTFLSQNFPHVYCFKKKKTNQAAQH